MGAVERDRRLSPFITVISGVASRRVGISPLSSKCDACLSAPQHLLFFLHSSTRFEVKLRVRNLSSSSPPFSCADQGETDWWRAGTAGRQARRTRTNVFTTLQPSRRLENTTGGRTIVPAERLTLSRSPPSLPPCPVPQCNEDSLDLRAFTAISSLMENFNVPVNELPGHCFGVADVATTFLTAATTLTEC